ncbi:MAG: cupin domain-containing protein [Candidatus Nanohaloarchaea archaeon]
MIVRREEAEVETISGTGKVLEYPISEEVGVSVQKLEGRVPEKGYYVNSECHEVCYVKSGEAEVVIGGEEFELKKGDIYVIEAGEKSCVKADNLEIIVVTRPDWYEEQCEIVEK